MWFRVFLAGWSVVFFGLLVWMATHQSSNPVVFGRYSPDYFKLLVAISVLLISSLSAQWSFVYRKCYAGRREIILLFLAVLVSLMTAETVIRIFDPLGVSFFAENSRYHLEKVPDPVLIYRHQPGLNRTYQGVTVRFNELGLRERDLQTEREGESRVLLLGDSVTFGWGVPAVATFGRKLETKLASKFDHPVKTINTGVGSYNTVQEYAALRTFADIVHPELVILLYVENDFELQEVPFEPWSKLSFQGKSPPEASIILLQKSWVYRLGRFLAYQSDASSAQVGGSVRHGVKDSMKALSDIATYCREHNMGFVTFFYRAAGEPRSDLIPFLLDKVQAVGRKDGFPVVDVGSWWGDENIRLVTNSVIDSHPNELGHEILAQGMVDFLVAHGFANKTVAAAK